MRRTSPPKVCADRHPPSACQAYQYPYVVEGRRVGGRVRQRIVSSLGRADVLASHLDKVPALLRPYTRARLLQPHKLSAEQGLTYGPVLVARRLWDQLGTDEIIRRPCPSRPGLDVAETAFVLTAHRLLHPGSEHALAWWLKESWAVDGTEQRTCPQWGTHGRVRVAHRQVRQWHRTLDHPDRCQGGRWETGATAPSSGSGPADPDGSGVS